MVGERPRVSRSFVGKAVCLAFAWAFWGDVSANPWSFAWHKSRRVKPFEKKSPFDDALTGEGERGAWKPPDVSAGGGPTLKLSQVPVHYLATFEDEEDCDSAEDDLDYATLGGRTVRVTAVDGDWTRDGGRKVYVQGVHPDVPREEVDSFLSAVGQLRGLRREDDVRFGEVRFRTPAVAFDVKMELDGSRMHGKVLRAELDCTTRSLTNVLFHGLNGMCGWQDLKDHIVDTLPDSHEVKWCRIHGGPRIARLNFAQRYMAEKALKLRGSVLKGGTSRIDVYWPYNREVAPGEVRVSGLDPTTYEDDLYQHFASCGTLEEADLYFLDLPPEFRESQQLRVS